MKFRPGLKRQLNWLYARPVAHRGLHDAENGIIENTESAVEAAIAGAYAIEVDVQLAGDGEVMVFHDYTLDRLTHERGQLRSKSSAEIQNARFKHCSDRIQTLPELLEQVNERATLIIEVKSQWDGSDTLEARLAQVVRNYKGPLAVMSFDPQSVSHVRTYAPGITRGLTLENFHYDDEWDEFLSLSQRLALRRISAFSSVDPHFAAVYVKDLPSLASRLFKRLGLPVLSWTVRTEADRERATRFADQVIFERLRPA